MPKDHIHVMFEIPKAQHRKLKLLSIEQGCSMKSLLQKAVEQYLRQEPELQVRSRPVAGK